MFWIPIIYRKQSINIGVRVGSGAVVAGKSMNVRPSCFL